MMRKFFTGLILSCFFTFILAIPTHAQTSAKTASEAANLITTKSPQQTYYQAKITQITDETRLPGNTPTEFFYTQKLQVQRTDNRAQITLQAGSTEQPLSDTQRYKIGQEVVLVQETDATGQPQYSIADNYRIPAMVWLLIGFMILVILIAQKKGIAAIIGMFLSLAVVMYFMVPHILQGDNPVVIALIGAIAVSFITVYLCQGWSMEAHLTIVSMMLSLVAVGLLSYVAVHVASLAGLGSEEAAYLQFGATAKVNLQGLLLGGMMIGALGLLHDISMAQVSVVHELHDAKPEMDFAELYRRGMGVGRSHVASLVNTLILAYAASSLPLFLLFYISNSQPIWVTLNSEVIAEEVVRTLTGSIGLVLAVPISTLIASYFMIWAKPKISLSKIAAQGNHHH